MFSWIWFQFRFSGSNERFLMFVGTLCAVAHGASMPAMILIFGNMSDTLINNDKMASFVEDNMSTFIAINPNITTDTIMADPGKFM